MHTLASVGNARSMVALVMVMMMVAVGCGSSGTDSSAANTAAASDTASADNSQNASDASSSDSGSSAEITDTVANGGTPMAADSPLGEFFDGGFDEAVAEYTMQVEAAVKVCMAEQGFEFAVSENGRVNDIEQRQNEMTAREWTNEYGYGISTSFDSIAQSQASDPNAQIFFNLSEAEREVWIETLSGGGFGAATGDLGSQPLEEQGCIGQALIETGGQEAIEGLSEFGDIYAEGEEALFDRREMVLATAEWSRCMSEAGYLDLPDLDAPEAQIVERFETVIQPMSDALDNLSDEEGQALISGESLDLADLPDLDLDALRELQADEIAMALVDLDCYEAEIKDVYEPLRDEFERGLLTDYADQFDAIRNIGG